MKRYEIFCPDKNINLFKDDRSFKSKKYAKKVMQESTKSIPENFEIREVEVLTEIEKLQAQLKESKEVIQNGVYLILTESRTIWSEKAKQFLQKLGENNE